MELTDPLLNLASVLILAHLYLSYKLFRQDSSPDSIWFTIDQARSLRYSYSYLFIKEGLLIGILLATPVIALALFLIGTLAILGILNMLIFILSIPSLIFGGGRFSPFGKGVLDFLSTIPDWFEVELTAFTVPMLYAFVVLYYLIIPIFVGNRLGGYLEDLKSVILITVNWTFTVAVVYLLISPIFNQNALFPFDLLNGFMGIILFIFRSLVLIINAIVTRNKNDLKEVYELKNVGTVESVFSLLFSLIAYVTILGVVSIIIIDFQLSGNYSVSYYRVTIPFQVLFFIPYLFLLATTIPIFVRGDFPIDFRLKGIEMREELLEQAREFKELDNENIEDFVRAHSSKLV